MAKKKGLQNPPVEGPAANAFAAEPAPRAVHPKQAPPPRRRHPKEHDPDERPLPRGPYRRFVDRGPENAPPVPRGELE